MTPEERPKPEEPENPDILSTLTEAGSPVKKHTNMPEFDFSKLSKIHTNFTKVRKEKEELEKKLIQGEKFKFTYHLAESEKNQIRIELEEVKKEKSENSEVKKVQEEHSEIKIEQVESTEVQKVSEKSVSQERPIEADAHKPIKMPTLLNLPVMEKLEIEEVKEAVIILPKNIDSKFTISLMQNLEVINDDSKINLSRNIQTLVDSDSKFSYDSSMNDSGKKLNAYDKIKKEIDLKLKDLKEAFLNKDSSHPYMDNSNTESGSNKSPYINLKFINDSETESNELKLFRESASRSSLNKLSEQNSYQIIKRGNNFANEMDEEIHFEQLFLKF